MANKVTVADVDQAEAALLEAKKTARRARATRDERNTYQEAAQRLADVRTAWRRQEEAAGRRGLVGGDAAPDNASNGGGNS